MPDVTEESWYAEEIATFGDRLAAAREAQGLSTEDLAARLGVKARTVQQWEDDAKEPRGNRLQMMSGMLGVSMMWLMTGVGPGVPAPDDTEGKDLPRLLGDLRGLHREASRLASRISAIETRVERLIAREAA
jgi:transcriptional regulator with XRE-family HTH domain